MNRYTFKCKNKECDFHIEESSIYSLKQSFEEEGGYLYFELRGDGFLLDGDCPECHESFQYEI